MAICTAAGVPATAVLWPLLAVIKGAVLCPATGGSAGDLSETKIRASTKPVIHSTTTASRIRNRSA
jgi:hypothetical protein